MIRAILFLAVLWPTWASAQTLSGRVTGQNELPLPGATIVVREETSGRVSGGGAANAEGAYQLDIPRPGPWTIEVSFVGYETQTRRLTLREGEAQTWDVTLQRIALPNNEVTVAAARAEGRFSPITYSNITPRQLAMLPDATDLPVALSSQTGITAYSENGNGLGYTYLRLRGFDERRVAVSINGIPQNDPEGLSVYWINFYDLQHAVKDIQIQRGAGAAAYGSSAVAGALNIVVDPFTLEPTLSAEVGLGAFATRRFTGQWNSGLLRDTYVAFVRVSRVESDGYREGAWVDFTRVFAGVTRFGERTRFTVQAFGGPQRDGLAYYGISKASNEDAVARRANFAATTRDEEFFHQPRLELRHEWELRPGTTLTQTLFGMYGFGYFDFDSSWRTANYLRLPAGALGLTDVQRQQPLYEVLPNLSRLQFRATVDQGQVGYMARLAARTKILSWTAGFEARTHRSTHYGYVLDAPELPASVVGEEANARVYQYQAGRDVVSAYGSVMLRLLPQVAVQGDLQVSGQRFTFFNEAFFGNEFTVPYLFVNPRLGATFFPDAPTQVYASAAYAQREPRLKDFYDATEAGDGAEPLFAQGNGRYDFDAPLTRPEKGWNLEVGVRHVHPRYRVSLAGYYLALRDEIVRSGGLDVYGQPRTGNAERTEHRGVEVEAAVRLMAGLDLEGNASFSRDRFVEFMEYRRSGPVDRAGNRIAGFPERTANLTLRYARGPLEVRLTGQHTGLIPVDNTNAQTPETRVDPYTLVNATVALTHAIAGGRVRFAVDVNNLTNAKVLTWGSGADEFFPAATRHIFGRMTYTF